MKVFNQLNPPKIECEELDSVDIKCLDKISLTSVVDFMRMYAKDATFTPPTKEVLFDTDRFKVDVDSDVDERYIDVDDFPQEDSSQGDSTTRSEDDFLSSHDNVVDNNDSVD